MLRKKKNGLLAPAEQSACRDQCEETGPQKDQGGGTGDWRRWWRRAVHPLAHQDGAGHLENGEEDRVVAQRRSHARCVRHSKLDLSITRLQEGRDIVQLIVRRT